MPHRKYVNEIKRSQILLSLITHFKMAAEVNRKHTLAISVCLLAKLWLIGRAVPSTRLSRAHKKLELYF